MTPAHQKASSLFGRMYTYQLDKRSPVSWELAKKQAGICVDEIFEEYRTKVPEPYKQEMKFWAEVKSELLKL